MVSTCITVCLPAVQMRARGLPAGAVCVAGMKSRSLPLTVLGIREPEIKFLARGFFVRRDPQP